MSARPDPSAAEVVHGWFAGMSATWLALEPEVLVDAEDAVHQMRVTSRRLRALLKLWRPFLRGDSRLLADELRWVAHALGDARDGEVVKEHLCDAVDDLPDHANQGPVEERLVGGISADLRLAHDVLRDDLATDRFARIRSEVSRLGDPTRVRDWVGFQSTDLLVPMLRYRIDKVFQSWEAVGFTSPDDLSHEQLMELHHTRRRCKAVRYAGEAISGVSTEAAEWGARFKKLADTLGIVQDTVVTTDRVLAGRDAAAAAGEPLVGYDALVAAERARRHAAIVSGAELLDAARDDLVR